MSEKPQICFVDCFQLQKVAVAVQILSVLRASEGGSGSSNYKSGVAHIICGDLLFIRLSLWTRAQLELQWVQIASDEFPLGFSSASEGNQKSDGAQVK